MEELDPSVPALKERSTIKLKLMVVENFLLSLLFAVNAWQIGLNMSSSNKWDLLVLGIITITGNFNVKCKCLLLLYSVPFPVIADEAV